MEVKEQIKLRFNGVDFPSVHLNSLSPFNSQDEDGIEHIDIDIQPKAVVPQDNKNTFKIIMDVKLSVEDKFTLEVTGVGDFELSVEDIDAEVRKAFINANATAIMFPYVRAFISTLTSNLGKVTKPIIIPTRFFHGELEIVSQDTFFNSESTEL